jgi:hypothetical protein
MKLNQASESRGWVVAVVASAATIGLVAMIVASPWLMGSFVSRSTDWHELSEIGQAYGGVSAILSGLAFCGIAVSLILQWRQVRLTQVMTERERHFELVKMAVDDPTLMFTPIPVTSGAEQRRWMVFNLWVAHWAMLWDTRSINQVVLRKLFDGLFSDDLALKYWVVSRLSWRMEPGRRRRAFLAVADEAYNRALGARPGAVSQPSTEDGTDAGLDSNSVIASERPVPCTPGDSAVVVPDVEPAGGSKEPGY